MGGIAVLLFSYVMYMFYGPNGSRKSEGNHGVLYALEIITILVPAELPLVFQLGLLTSEVILQQSKISTADSSRIPLCGSVDVMCFDKTGTITQPDLEVIGVVPALRFTDGSLKFGEISRIGANIPNSLFRGLAVCHELNEVSEYVELQMSDYSDSPSKGVWSGPVLDQKLFAATGLTLQNAPTVADFNYVIGRGIDEDYGKTTGRMEILRRFEFDHGLQRMSVIVRDPLTKKFYVFMKGSPEAVAPCCNQRDGVPRTWKKDTNKYSKRGSYVIGMFTE
jgi:cation-transporting ATPase 13A2